MTFAFECKMNETMSEITSQVIISFKYTRGNSMMENEYV